MRPEEVARRPLHHQKRAGQEVVDISDMDVYCGRDKRNHSHPGNIRFRDLIKAHRERYQNASLREYKTRITSEIIGIVHSYGGRFLKLNEETGHWYEVDGAYIHDKVSHALRSAKDPDRPRPQRRRPPRVEEPTAAEDEAFWKLVGKQEKIYVELQRKKESLQSLGLP